MNRDTQFVFVKSRRKYNVMIISTHVPDSFHQDMRCSSSSGNKLQVPVHLRTSISALELQESSPSQVRPSLSLLSLWASVSVIPCQTNNSIHSTSFPTRSHRLFLFCCVPGAHQRVPWTRRRLFPLPLPLPLQVQLQVQVQLQLLRRPPRRR